MIEPARSKFFMKCLCVLVLCSGCVPRAAGEPALTSFHPPGIENLVEIDVAEGVVYSAETVIVEGVIAESGQGAWKGKNDGYKVHCVSLAAWRIAGEPLQETELTVLRAIPPDSAWREDFDPYDVWRFKVLLSDSRTRAVLQEAMKIDSPGDRMAAVVAKLKKPVVFRADGIGELLYDRSYDWFEGEVAWGEQTVVLYLPTESTAFPAASIEACRALLENRSSWRRDVEEFASRELLTLKNEGWLEEGERPLTSEQFLSRLVLESITVHPDGGFEFWFADGDMFWGHWIEVAGSLSEGPTRADIQG